MADFARFLANDSPIKLSVFLMLKLDFSCLQVLIHTGGAAGGTRIGLLVSRLMPHSRYFYKIGMPFSESALNGMHSIEL